MRSSGGWILMLALLSAAVTAGCREEAPIPPSSLPPSTQPAVPPPLAAGPSTCKAPHDGRLLAIEDGVGYIEWDVSKGRLYCLDGACKPLSGVKNASLYLRSRKGPVELAMRDCGDAEYPGACLTTEDGSLRSAEAIGVMRFELGGARYRVVLVAPVPETQPSGIKPPPGGKQLGS